MPPGPAKITIRAFRITQLPAALRVCLAAQLTLFSPCLNRDAVGY